jgi:hypothetical protein
MQVVRSGENFGQLAITQAGLPAFAQGQIELLPLCTPNTPLRLP